jgi:hypothetical protein
MAYRWDGLWLRHTDGMDCDYDIQSGWIVTTTYRRDGLWLRHTDGLDCDMKFRVSKIIVGVNCRLFLCILEGFALCNMKSSHRKWQGNLLSWLIVTEYMCHRWPWIYPSKIHRKRRQFTPTIILLTRNFILLQLLVGENCKRMEK